MEKNKHTGSSIRDSCSRVDSLGAQVHSNTAAACNNVPVVVERYACFDRLHTAIIVPGLFMSLLQYIPCLIVDTTAFPIFTINT